MRMVALTDRKWAIGKGGDLLVRIPKDHQLFLQETLGCHVVMGRKTGASTSFFQKILPFPRKAS